MIRHIFIAPFREDVEQDVIDATIAEWAGLENVVPGMEGFALGKAAGFVGLKNGVVLTADLIDADTFKAFMGCDKHRAAAKSGAAAFQMDKATIVQVEI